MQFLQRMTRNLYLIQEVCHMLEPEEYLWKSTPESWSILEIINHLHDEEREDFRVRIDLTLHHPGKPWPPIDPQGWVGERRYQENDFSESLLNFSQERQKSLDWLNSLDNPDWDRVYKHPSLGKIKAGDLFASWQVHDDLHFQQIIRAKINFLNQFNLPYESRYAMP